MKSGHKWTYTFLSSKELTITLFPALCLALIITTFTGETGAFLWNIVRILFALIVINLSLCTLVRIKTLSKPVLIIHIGVIITFIGGGISSFGFVATVNIYEGSTVDKVYRWDIKKDVYPGMAITVKRLHEEYYPVPVKVGALSGDEKIGLFTLKTGESFSIEKYRIKVDAFNIASQNLNLSIFNGDNYIRHADTSGSIEMPADFPFAFKLVAYMTPKIKRTWVDLRLSSGSDIFAEGSTEVNNPFRWQGMNFHHTATNRDKYGNTYVGIQITKDPETPFVYLGFCIVGVGGGWYFIRRLRGYR